MKLYESGDGMAQGEARCPYEQWGGGNVLQGGDTDGSRQSTVSVRNMCC